MRVPVEVAGDMTAMREEQASLVSMDCAARVFLTVGYRTKSEEKLDKYVTRKVDAGRLVDAPALSSISNPWAPLKTLCRC